jgi:hypothetical protein
MGIGNANHYDEYRFNIPDDINLVARLISKD